MSDVATTPVTGGVAEGSSEPAATSAKVKFDPSAFDQSELDAWVESRKHKVKVNGKEREYSSAELKRLASLSDAATEKFQSASQKEKEAKDLKAAFETGDPVAALKKLGKDSKEIKSILENKLLEMIEEEQLDPRDRELKSYKQKEAEREAAEKARQEEEEVSKRSQQLARVQQEIEHSVVEALTVSGLPKSPVITKSVFQVMLDAASKGVEIDPRDAVSMVKADYFDQVSKLLPALGVAEVKKLLGADLLKALKEDTVKEFKQADTPFPKPAQRKPENKAKKQAEEPENQSMSEYFRNLRRGGAK